MKLTLTQEVVLKLQKPNCLLTCFNLDNANLLIRDNPPRVTVYILQNLN